MLHDKYNNHFRLAVSLRYFQIWGAESDSYEKQEQIFNATIKWLWSKGYWRKNSRADNYTIKHKLLYHWNIEKFRLRNLRNCYHTYIQWLRLIEDYITLKAQFYRFQTIRFSNATRLLRWIQIRNRDSRDISCLNFFKPIHHSFANIWYNLHGHISNNIAMQISEECSL